MDMETAIPSNWFSAGDFDSIGQEFTIANVKFEKVGGNDKPVVWFYHQRQGLVLNSTTNKELMKLYGKESNAWVGKKIVVYSYLAAGQFGGAPQQRLAVRAPDSKAPKAQPTPIPKRLKDELEDEIPI